MIERKINRLNEEISRWAFEVKAKKLNDWKIIFTNPTAGPWKKIMCDDEDGNIGEVYRFQLEEERPDIVMINDELRMILIIEAKDSIDKLMKEKQIYKTVQVVEDMAKMFKKKENNKFWKNRANYKTYLGLLWGSNDETETSKVDELFEKHLEEMQNKNDICNTILVGIETIYKKEENFINCIPHYYFTNRDELVNSVILSLTDIRFL